MTLERILKNPPTDGTLQLLVCDLDGTLLESDGSISERTRSALDAVRHAGVRVAVATGRVPSGIASIVRDLDLDGPQITMHGALVIAPVSGETVFSVTDRKSTRLNSSHT